MLFIFERSKAALTHKNHRMADRFGTAAFVPWKARLLLFKRTSVHKEHKLKLLSKNDRSIILEFTAELLSK